MNRLLPRHQTVRNIASRPETIIFLRAPAGAGKSVVLRMLGQKLYRRVCLNHQPRMDDIDDGVLLWDVPVTARSARLPSKVLDGTRRIIIACRPEQRISGLSRRVLHEGAITISAKDLIFREDETVSLPVSQREKLMKDYGGWPAFLTIAARADDDSCLDYMRETFLTPLSPAQIYDLSIWLEAPLAETAGDWKVFFPPALTSAPERHGDLLRFIRVAVQERLSMLIDSGGVVDMAAAMERSGRPLAAMEMLLDHGHQEHAAQILERAHGRELIYRSSVEAFQNIIMRFSQSIMSTNETVLFAVARSLLKQGELSRARYLTSRHMGHDYLDPLKVLNRNSRFSFAARTFRLNLMISEDLTPTDAMIVQLGEFMADYPLGDYGKWSGYYNAILEFEIRRRNFREAEAAAARALIYLGKQDGQPLLEFFIHLHQIVLRLMSGDVLMARRAAKEARDKLESVPHDASQEFRMMRLAEACLAYEAGRPRELLDFVQNEFEAFAAAEIWPSLMQFALHYASQVLSDNFAMTIRPGFLDGLWIHLSEGLQFHAMMEIRTAIAYQNASRWADAAAILTAIRMPISRSWVNSATDELTRLSRRDEIAYALAWLRDAIHIATPHAYLHRQLEALLSNPKVTNRERVGLQLWQSYASHQRRDRTSARTQLLSALETATRLGCNGVLSEERQFLSPLLNDQRIRSFIETSSDVRTALSIFAGSITSPHARAIHGGLSQREAQMLQLVASGLANKKIASTLNISEVTVKFHIGNLLRKLGCTRRAEAIKAAKALGWI